MPAKQNKGKSGKKMVSANMTFEMIDQLDEVSEKTGANRSTSIRRAVDTYLKSGANNGQIIMNLVELTQRVQELGIGSGQDTTEIENLIQNITILMAGGK